MYNWQNLTKNSSDLRKVFTDALPLLFRVEQPNVFIVWGPELENGLHLAGTSSYHTDSTRQTSTMYVRAQEPTRQTLPRFCRRHASGAYPVQICFEISTSWNRWNGVWSVRCVLVFIHSNGTSLTAHSISTSPRTMVAFTGGFAVNRPPSAATPSIHTNQLRLDR